MGYTNIEIYIELVTPVEYPDPEWRRTKFSGPITEWLRPLFPGARMVEWFRNDDGKLGSFCIACFEPSEKALKYMENMEREPRNDMFDYIVLHIAEFWEQNGSAIRVKAFADIGEKDVEEYSLNRIAGKQLPYKNSWQFKHDQVGPEPPVANIKKIAILGSSDIGYGIAGMAALAGYKVKFYDIKQEFIDRGMGKVLDSFAQQVSQQKITQEAMNNALRNMSGYINLRTALEDVDYVLEAVPDIPELKLKVFKECDEYAPKHAILASTSSSVSISGIAEATLRPDKVIALRFGTMAVEVIRGNNTSEETSNISVDLVRSWKMVATVK